MFRFLTAARRPAIPIAIEDRGYGRLRHSRLRRRGVIEENQRQKDGFGAQKKTISNS
jgi:hypothetical protein